MNIIISVIVGLIVGFIVRGMMLSELKSVVKQYAAADYMKKDSFRLAKKDDLFLYKKTERQPLPQNPPQSSDQRPGGGAQLQIKDAPRPPHRPG